MSATIPPLAAMISAVRRSVRLTASADTCGSASQSAWRRAKPSGSRVRARLRVSAPSPAPPATRQRSEGRTMLPQADTTRAPDSSSRSHCDARPCSRCQAIGSARQFPPASSAPLAIQRCCQVSPGWADSQSRNQVRARLRRSWLSALARTNIPLVSRSKTSPRSCLVAGQSVAAGRDGNAVLADSRRALDGRAAIPGNMIVSPLTTCGPRTARPSSRAGSPAPAPGGPAARPAGSARHDGPGPGGSPLPCGA